MKAFENFEMVTVSQPSNEEVLDRIRRDEPCRADPLSVRCISKAKDRFLLEDVTRAALCENCEVLVKKHQEMLAEWEAWCLALQDVYA